MIDAKPTDWTALADEAARWAATLPAPRDRLQAPGRDAIDAAITAHRTAPVIPASARFRDVFAGRDPYALAASVAGLIAAQAPLEVHVAEDGSWFVACSIDGGMAWCDLDEAEGTWRLLAWVDMEIYAREAADLAVRLERIVWTGTAAILRPALPSCLVALIEQEVRFDLADLPSTKVGFHTVMVGPVVVLCDRAGHTASIFDVMSEAEYEASLEPVAHSEELGEVCVARPLLAGNDPVH